MAYNKAKAEREWLHWKEEEENQLRQMGVPEESIQRLHHYDWKAFCSERKFLERQQLNTDYIDAQADATESLPITTVQNLLGDINDTRLYKVLQEADETTLKILLLKIAGFSGKEINQKLGLDEFAINQRIYRLRKKLKKFF